MLNDVQLTTLPCRARVITSRIAHVESVSLGVWVGVGARCEPNRLAGASHFMEHMVFKGTGRRSAREISQAIEGRGGYLNAFTQEENTCFYARVPFDSLPKAFDVLADMYLDPTLADGEIARERGVVLDEMQMYRDQPQHLVHDMAGEALWNRHPLGRPVVGREKTIEALSRDELTRFWQKHYVPANTVFAFAGKLEHEACVALVQGALGARAPGRRSRFRKAGDEVALLPMAVARREIEQVHAVMGIRLFGRTDERRFALRILSAVLGENMSSRLFQTVRERYGLAYSVQSSIQLFADTGALLISAGLDRARAVRALNLIVKELVRLRTRPVPKAEFRRARDYLLGQLRLGLESTSNHMNWVGENLLALDRFVHPDEVMEKLSAVTPADVQAVACDVLRSEAVSLSAVAPSHDAVGDDALRETLSPL